MRTTRSQSTHSLVWPALAVSVAVLGFVLVLASPVWHEGLSWFFRGSDPRFFYEVARSPLGDGGAFSRLGIPFESSYRYGRIGYPLLGWLLAFGHPAWLTFTLEALNLAAIIAVPLLSLGLLDAYGVAPLGGLLTAFVPGLYVLATHAYSDGLLVAILLLGYLLEARGGRIAAKGAFAYATLVKETAILAILAMFIRALRRRDLRDASGWALAVVPYFAWATWVRFRVGEFPFLSNDPSRKNALSAPFVALFDAWRGGSHQTKAVVLIVLLTAGLGTLVAWAARATPVAGAAGAFALFALCTGPTTLAFPGDTLRVLIVPQVLCIVCGAYARAVRPAGTRRVLGLELTRDH
jgi:hypothetical protein